LAIFADRCVAYMDVGKGREQERKLYWSCIACYAPTSVPR